MSPGPGWAAIAVPAVPANAPESRSAEIASRLTILFSSAGPAAACVGDAPCLYATCPAVACTVRQQEARWGRRASSRCGREWRVRASGPDCCYGVKVCWRTTLPPWMTVSVALVKVVFGVIDFGHGLVTEPVVTENTTFPFSGRRLLTVPVTVSV